MPQNRGEYSNRMNANQQNGMSTPKRTSSLRNFFQLNQEILRNQAEQRLNPQQGLGGLDPRTVNPLNSPIAQGPRSRFTLNQPTRQNNIPQNNNPQNNNTANNPFLPRNFSVNTQNQRLQRNQNHAPFQPSKLANEIKRPDSPLTPTRRDDLKNAFSSLDKEFNSLQESLKKSRSWTINKRDEKYNAINSSSENRTKDKELVPQTPKSHQPSPSLGNRPKI